MYKWIRSALHRLESQLWDTTVHSTKWWVVSHGDLHAFEFLMAKGDVCQLECFRLAIVETNGEVLLALRIMTQLMQPHSGLHHKAAFCRNSTS